MVTEHEIMEALKNVYDPETGLDIVNMGLIYDVQIQDKHVQVKMTLTTPGCPLSDRLSNGARNAILQLEGVESCHVAIVWDPPWHPRMMSDEAKLQLGFKI
ncbi:MAG: metal-sulfur cluster assembly factor [bacterium]|nr:metal-sulfur cluster assembly factor [bacterium]